MPVDKVLIAIPTLSATVTTGLASSLSNTCSTLTSHGVAFQTKFFSFSDVVESRNILADYFVRHDEFTCMLFVDTDMTFNPSTVIRLLESDVPIVGCVYPKRHINMNRLISASRKFDDIDIVINAALDFVVKVDSSLNNMRVTGGLCKVDGVGMGLCLIRRAVFTELIGSNRVDLVRHSAAGLDIDKVYNFFGNVHDNGTYLSEDFSFCYRWRSFCEGEVWGLISEKIGHTGVMTFAGSFMDHLRTRGNLITASKTDNGDV